MAGPAPLPLPAPPQQAKPAWQSLTFWSTLLMGLGGLAETVAPQYVPPGSTASAAAAIGVVAGMIGALYGRFRAQGPLTVAGTPS